MCLRDLLDCGILLARIDALRGATNHFADILVNGTLKFGGIGWSRSMCTMCCITDACRCWKASWKKLAPEIQFVLIMEEWTDVGLNRV